MKFKFEALGGQKEQPKWHQELVDLQGGVSDKKEQLRNVEYELTDFLIVQAKKGEDVFNDLHINAFDYKESSVSMRDKSLSAMRHLERAYNNKEAEKLSQGDEAKKQELISEFEKSRFYSHLTADFIRGLDDPSEQVQSTALIMLTHRQSPGVVDGLKKYIKSGGKLDYVAKRVLEGLEEPEKSEKVTA